MYLKVSSAKRLPFCLGLNVLKPNSYLDVKSDILYTVVNVAIIGVISDILYTVVNVAIIGVISDILYTVVNVAIIGVISDILHTVVNVAIIGVISDILYTVVNVAIIGVISDILYTVVNGAIIGSGNGWLPTWRPTRMYLNQSSGTKHNHFHSQSLFKMSSAKLWPFCFGLTILKCKKVLC